MTETLPGPTVGVVGGGQLGRMLGEAAAPLGIDLVVSDPTPDAPAAPVASEQVLGDFDDEATIRTLAEQSDYLTLEIELADPDALERVCEETETLVHPAPATLRTIQDKYVQKERMAAAGVPVPGYQRVESPDDLRNALDDLGYPAMLKAREGGYDGRGNVPVESPDEVGDAFAAIEGPAMVEEFVEFERELAVMGVIGADERKTYPVTETIHRDEILRETVAPARTSTTVRDRARAVALDVLDVMEGRGVYGIELFETADGEILLNEVAPRPHNSGHWTIEGAHTSQFEQHLRAVTGQPLGTTAQRAPTVTANILGDIEGRGAPTLRGIDNALGTDRLSVHWYGKDEVYALRKMGHLTGVADGESRAALLEAVRERRDALTFHSSPD